MLAVAARQQGTVCGPIEYGIVRATVTAPGHVTGRFLTIPAHFMARRTGGSGPQFDAALGQSLTDTTVPLAALLGRLKFPSSVALPGCTSCSWRTQDGDLDAAGLWTLGGSKRHFRR
ncbi:hypothetical protein [Streptomyces sp. NPDC005141]